MTAPVLRRLPAAALAATLALALPVVMVGPDQASAKPRPVRTELDSHPLKAMTKSQAAALGGRSAAQSEVVPLPGRVHVVGVTWDRGGATDDAEVQIREERDGAWGEWTTLHVEPDHGPDPGSREAEHSRPGTDPWVSTADAVQARVVAQDRELADAPQLDVVDPGESPADAPVTSGPGSASARAVRPTIYTRKQWGADERLRDDYIGMGEVRAAVVHHTAGSNNYSASDVPAIIRGIYRFHVTGNGWDDIGYNFLIDKFGRIWEGRYGGVDKPVVGAHALGVNSQTYGASILGDFTSTAPTSAALTAQAKLAAWKLGLSYVDPTAKTTLDGYGTFRTVNGHRDTYATSCPGQKVYDKLPWIRSRAKTYQGTMFYDPSINATTRAFGAGGVTVQARAGTALSWRLTVKSPCRSETLAVVRGQASSGERFSASWDGMLSDGSPAPPGEYRVRLGATNGSGKLAAARPITYRVKVSSATGAPPSFCPPRLVASDRYSFSVAAARRVGSTTKVVLVNGTSKGTGLAFVAAPLAGAKGAVLLQTHPDYLSAATRAEIIRRGVTDVTIVGGPAWVSEEVVAELAAIGIDADHVERIGGSSRYELAGNVARAIADGGPVPDVIVANGSELSTHWLALTAPATALHRPILLTRSDRLPSATAAVLEDLEVQRTTVAGGTRRVSDEVVAQLPDPLRLQASNRYTLSVVVADWARDSGVDVSRVFVGSGAKSAAPNTISAGQKGWVELFVAKTYVPSDVAAWLDGNSALTRADILGSARSVSMLTGGRVQESVVD
jgi:hypothetical protein